MDWKDLAYAWGTLSFCFFLLILGVAVGYYAGNPQPSWWKGQMEGLGNDLNQLKQGQGVLFQGKIEIMRGIQDNANIDYNGLTKLIRIIQDMNAKISLNEQAIQTLNYLSSSACQRTDTKETMTIRCLKNG